MKVPQSCPHSEVGPCAECLNDFRARVVRSKMLQAKGCRVSAAVADKLTLNDWKELDRLFSPMVGREPTERTNYEPE